jgi:hypothetical protein
MRSPSIAFPLIKSTPVWGEGAGGGGQWLAKRTEEEVLTQSMSAHYYIYNKSCWRALKRPTAEPYREWIPSKVWLWSICTVELKLIGTI